MKSKAKKLADMGMFLAVGIILNICSFPVFGYFGRASFVYSVCYLAGIFLGPISGFLVSFLADMLPALILPSGGAWIPQISLSIGLISFFVGACVKFLRLPFGFKFAIGVAISYLICTLVITPWGETLLFDMYPYTFAKALGRSLGIESKFLMLSLSKGITQSLWTCANAIMSYMVYKRVHTFYEKRSVCRPIFEGNSSGLEPQLPKLDKKTN